MTKEELQQKLNDEDVLVLDIREPDELQERPSLPTATSMPMGKVFVEAAKGNLPKDKQLVTICQTGDRCRIVTEQLKAQDFNIDYLEGGLAAWDADEQ